MENPVIPVVVSGEVQKPGKKVSLIREVQGDHRTQIVDLSPILKGMPTPAMYVCPGDVIYIRPRFISF